MVLIMIEKKYIEDIIKTKKSTDEISDRYLIKMLIRYFNNLDNKKELIDQIHNLCKELNINNYKEYEFFNKIVKCVKEEEKSLGVLRDIEYIPLLQEELDIINQCKKDREKKFLFVCYIMARFNNSDWININDKDLFKMANISLSCKDRQLFIHNMIEKGYISQAKKNTNNSLKIQRLNGKETAKVTDFNNMGNFILAYLKPNYIQCEKCGKLVKMTGTNDKYCNDCKNDYYIKINQKEIICKDCGKIFLADGVVKNKTRCDECQLKYNSYLKKQSYYQKKYEEGYVFMFNDKFYSSSANIHQMNTEELYLIDVKPLDSPNKQFTHMLLFSDVNERINPPVIKLCKEIDFNL